MKKVIRLTESNLRNIIKESVRQVLRESSYIDELRERALNGDIDAWVELGVGSPGNWEGFEKWRREKLGLRSKNQGYEEQNSWVEMTPDYKFTH